jgi:hypothetical protein
MELLVSVLVRRNTWEQQMLIHVVEESTYVEEVKLVWVCGSDTGCEE